MNEALAALLKILNELGIRFFAVGSVASSIHGLPRFTRHVDLVAKIPSPDVESLAGRVSSEFYLDSDEARKALEMGRAFNLIHLATAAKFDIFPLQQDAFHASELARSTEHEWVIPGEGAVRLPVASPEDTILSKLLSYKKGGQVSDQQWSDILGVASRPAVDWDYMRLWAIRLGVADLLDRLKKEASQVHFE